MDNKRPIDAGRLLKEAIQDVVDSEEVTEDDVKPFVKMVEAIDKRKGWRRAKIQAAE